MIVFDLECSKGHIFEAWFKNLQSFEKQKAKRLVDCPYCNDTNIRKVISPVAMKTSSQPDEKKDVSAIDYHKLAKEMVDYINKNFHDVGPNFSKEALKMHYGVTEKKNIKGSATAEEEKIMRDEKIEFFKIPTLKIDDKKRH